MLQCLRQGLLSSTKEKGELTKVIQLIINIITYIFKIIHYGFFYRGLYALWGAFSTRRFPRAKKLHKYAVLVAARNEEAVIGNLIDSIRLQDYPKELVDIFVVADNCSDNTARIAKEMGAVCYERFDAERRTKGFALQFLVENIRRDYGIDSYEGYFLFDADNLLKEDFISRMNDSFDAGEKIITSYRNTKNFDDNWISASYGLHWLRTVRTEHRARSDFRLATRIQGTGFLFSREIIKDGWNYTGLTEDRALCADAVAGGYQISYNDEAEFYDEQPVDIKTAMRQRIRWAKGHLQAFSETGGKLFYHIFVTDGAGNRHIEKEKKISTFGRLVNNIRLRFMSYDMLLVVYPRALLNAFKDVILYILNAVLIISSLEYFTPELAGSVLRGIFDLFGTAPSPDGALEGILLFTLFCVADSAVSYLGGIAMAAYVFFAERKRIMRIKWYKKLWFCFTFPVFDLIGKLSSCIALFSKAEWKPIPHNAAITISEVNKKHLRQ